MNQPCIAALEMATLDEITRSLKDIYQRLAVSGKRTAAITRLRMELTGLDKQRKEIFSKLGEHVSELKRTGQIRDAGVLTILEDDFESLDRVRKKIQETMDAIQEMNLEEIESDGVDEPIVEEGLALEAQNLLDSFEVL